MTDVYYVKDNTEYRVGDKVTGKFGDGDDSKYGTVCFGLFDAYWPNGSHEWAEAFGFYIKTEKHNGYSITQIKGLAKYKK